LLYIDAFLILYKRFLHMIAILVIEEIKGVK